MNTVDFGYSAHRYSGHLDIVNTLGGTEYLPILSSLNNQLILVTHFRCSGHLPDCIIMKI